MLGIVILLAMIVFAAIAPIMAIRRYYSLKQHDLKKNVMFLLVTVVTWPLAPMLLTIKNRDYGLLSMFAISFMVCLVAIGYFVSEYAQELSTLTQQMIM